MAGLGQGEYKANLELTVPKSKEVLHSHNDGAITEVNQDHPSEAKQSLVMQSLR